MNLMLQHVANGRMKADKRTVPFCTGICFRSVSSSVIHNKSGEIIQKRSCILNFQWKTNKTSPCIDSYKCQKCFSVGAGDTVQ